MSRTTRAADISPQQSVKLSQNPIFQKTLPSWGRTMGDFVFHNSRLPSVTLKPFFFFFFCQKNNFVSRWSVADTITTKLTGRYINYRARDSRRKNPLGFSTAPRWVWKSDLWRWVARGVKSPHAVEVCVFPALSGCLLPKSHRLQLTCMWCHYF